MKCSVYCYPPECASQSHDAAPPSLPSSRYAAPQSWFLCCGHQAARSDVPHPTNSYCNTVSRPRVICCSSVSVTLVYQQHVARIHTYLYTPHFLSSVIGWETNEVWRKIYRLSRGLLQTTVFWNVTYHCLKDEYQHFEAPCFLASRWKQQICPKHWECELCGIRSQITILSAFNVIYWF